MIYNDDTSGNNLSVEDVLKEERKSKAGGDVYEESEEGVAYTLSGGNTDTDSEKENSERQ